MEEKNKYIINDSGADAIAFLPKFEIDMETMKQIKHMIVHPAIAESKIRIMPDCHRGVGCCVGFTYELKERIVPNFVGGDIGCGILTYPVGTDLLRQYSLKKIEKTIRNSVHMGNGHENIWETPIANESDLEGVFQQSIEQATQFAQSYLKKFKVDISAHIPKYDVKWLKNKCLQIGANYEVDIFKCLGTLGGGNHYIEVNQDQDDHSAYITIHCGSRGFGTKICYYHQHKINDNREFPHQDFNDKIKNIRRKHKDSKQIKQLTDQVRHDIEENKHPLYLEKEEAYEYYMDMIFCQKYACLNRQILLQTILSSMNLEYDNKKVIESIHNYIDFTDFIVRKGAISAYNGQTCIVSLNMRDGILLCEGKSNADWNYSCAHGSGRILSRQKASNSLSLKKFQKEMENVYSTSVVKETLDESPMAYKDTNFIKLSLNDTVTIVKHLLPVINLKAID